VLIVIALVLILSFRFLQSDGALPVDWKICLNWVQTLSFLPELALSWPSSMSTLFRISSFSSFNLELFSPECSIPISLSQGYHLKANILWILTGILILAILIQHLAAYTRLKSLFKSQSMEVTLCKLFDAVIVVYASLFTYLILNVFSPVRCSRQLDGRLLMTSSLTVQCGSEEWNPLFNAMLMYCVLYLVVFPVTIALLFWKFRYRIGSREEQMLIGGLTRSYKKEFFWWEIINVTKKVSLTISLSFPSSSRNMIFFVVLILFMCLEITVRPFKLEVQSQLNSLWSLLTLLILGLGLSSLDSSLDPRSLEIVSSLVIIIFCLIVGFSLRSTFYFIVHRLARKRSLELAPASANTPPAVTVVANDKKRVEDSIIETVEAMETKPDESNKSDNVASPVVDLDQIKIYPLGKVHERKRAFS